MKGKYDYENHFTLKNDIYYHDLTLPTQPKITLGKYAMLRLDFLKTYRKGVYTTLVSEARLTEHLYEIDQEARKQVKLITEQLAKQHGIDEALKATDQMRWVQEMNNCKAAAEEIVINNIILK